MENGRGLECEICNVQMYDSGRRGFGSLGVGILVKITQVRVIAQIEPI